MVTNKNIFVILVISILLCKLSLGDNKDNNKLKDVLRNTTFTKLRNHKDQSNDQNDDNKDDNVLKTEAKKMLKRCGGDSNESQNWDSYGYDNNKNKDNFNKYDENKTNNRPTNQKHGNNYGQEETDYSNNNNKNDGDWSAYGNENRNNRPNHQFNQNYNGNKRESNYKNNNNPQSYNGQSSSDSNQNKYGGRNLNNQNEYSGQNFGYGDNYGRATAEGNPNNNRGTQNEYGRYRPQNVERGSQLSDSNNKNSYFPYRSYDEGVEGNADCNENKERTYGRNEFGYNNGPRFGFTNGQHNLRSKRNNYFNRTDNEENDDTECISQCIFGNLHLLDDDRTPSETMVIKWLQEHINGNDMDRIKALRDARRCFARLATSDIEDGCDFSKELAKCLDLDLD